MWEGQFPRRSILWDLQTQSGLAAQTGKLAVDKDTTNSSAVTIGIDLGDRKSHLAVIDGDGEWVGSATVRTSRSDIARALVDHRGVRVVLEVGTHSPWVSRMLAERGFDVVVANRRRVRLIAAAHRKSDEVDAEFLARLGRTDRELLAPIAHRSEQAQADLVLRRTRDGLVEARSKLINMVRGQAKALGLCIPGFSAPSFHNRARLCVKEKAPSRAASLRVRLSRAPPTLHSVATLPPQEGATLVVRTCGWSMPAA
jgi:transposase